MQVTIYLFCPPHWSSSYSCSLSIVFQVLLLVLILFSFFFHVLVVFPMFSYLLLPLFKCLLLQQALAPTQRHLHRPLRGQWFDTLMKSSGIRNKDCFHRCKQHSGTWPKWLWTSKRFVNSYCTTHNTVPPHPWSFMSKPYHSDPIPNLSSPLE